MMTNSPHSGPISGTTRLYAVLGDPVTQVQSPGLLNPVFVGLGVDAVLVPVHVRRDDLVHVVRGLQRVGNLDGLFVTVPHKTAAAHLADRRSRTVEISGSANALRREPDGAWLAANFDGSGFVAGLVGAGHSPGEGKWHWPARAERAAPSRRPCSPRVWTVCPSRIRTGLA